LRIIDAERGLQSPSDHANVSAFDPSTFTPAPTTIALQPDGPGPTVPLLLPVPLLPPPLLPPLLPLLLPPSTEGVV
jgi:hypothetical protein